MSKSITPSMLLIAALSETFDTLLLQNSCNEQAEEHDGIKKCFSGPVHDMELKSKSRA